VVDPDKPMEVPKLVLEEDRKLAFDQTREAVIKGTDTRIPQPVPPGTTEDAVGIMESLLDDLPSAGYFLKTLYRQHYPGEDADGIPPWMQDFYRKSRPLRAAPKQVNAAP